MKILESMYGNPIQRSDLIPKPLTSNSSYREFATIRGQATDQTIYLALQLTRRYIVLGFLDHGGCKILSSVRITYNICPGTTLSNSLVDLRETVAPSSDFESILVEGACAENSFHIQGSLNVTCESSGQWNVSQFEGKCFCKEDMENVGGTCTGMFRNQYDHYNSLQGCFFLLSVEWTGPVLRPSHGLKKRYKLLETLIKNANKSVNL